ncbi:protein kinase domain-containing protein [Nocardioides lijunqiniae]|uniref:protein kinase domain-containing protein n=1 Tax=Nocardioides lijunqiniae TaxID=2760832 RepID=UPI001878207E|nr:protein kinase [Nocardioides lijunqiniae]
MPQFPRVGDLFGRYRIDAQIGQGGMGVVFAATDTAFDRRVALKVVSAALGGSAEFLARFEREASLLARLNSPHVIAIFDYGEQDGCPYLATQYVGGGDLGALLAARGPMPPQLASSVCAQVADALGDAHRAGVVHRDVKPTNVLLRDADTRDLHAYLCDFGIARSDSEGLTAPGSVSGTWSYLAPECGAGAPGTVSSDVYALGCLFWATLTGSPPFRGSDVEIAIAHQNAPLPQLAGDDAFTRHANAILANTLAKDPRARYDTADALRADLLAAAGIPSTGIRPLSSPAIASSPSAPTALPSGGRVSLGSLPRATSPGGGPRRRRTGLVVTLSCLAVLAVTGGIVAATQLGDDPEPGPSGGGTTTAAPTSADPTPTGPTETPKPEVVGPVTGDQDGDGLGDVTARWRPEGKSFERVATWHSDGSALALADQRRERTTRDYSREEVLGDFDGDDVLELVVVDTPAQTGEITVKGTLSGGAAVKQRLARPQNKPYVTPIAGDADGDGLDDLMLVSWALQKPMALSVARSDGTRFGKPAFGVEVPFGYQDTSVEVGDLDGDGRADLALLTTPDVPAGDRSRSTVRTYLSQEDGRFVERGKARTFTSDIGPGLHAMDIDGDEDTELLVSSDQDSFMELVVLDHQRGGMGKPRPAGVLPQPPRSYYDSEVVVGDYDGDGRDDVAGLGRAPAGKKTALQVALSSGKRLGGASVWATWDLELTDYYGLNALGSSFP